MGESEVKAKAKILIRYNGETYRVGESFGCSSKRDCDLFRRGVCDVEETMYEDNLPCDPINDAFIYAAGCVSSRCFMKVKAQGLTGAKT